MKTVMVLVAVLWAVMAGMAWAGKPLEMDIDIIDIESTSVVVVDKKVLTELLVEAQREGASLNVAVYEYDDKREVWDRARPAPCLDTMEAAMRAMEPFVPRWWVNLDLPMNGGVRQELSHDEMPRFRDAAAQWAEAKACWRKP